MPVLVFVGGVVGCGGTGVVDGAGRGGIGTGFGSSNLG